MSAEHDLLVVGGGIVGLGVAVHAARLGLDVVLVEAGPLGGRSTQRSGALVRTHYPDARSARLALRGLERFEAFAACYGGPGGFVATGFAYVPLAEETATGILDERMAMLRAIGAETTLLDADALAAVDPALDLGDGGVCAFEPRSGYADPAWATATLAAAARDAGADLRPFTAVAALGADGGDAVWGATLAGGATVQAATTVLCAGAHCTALARGVGLELPVRATAVKLALLERRVAHHLTVIDAPNGTYFRPDGARATLVGRRTWTDEPLPGPDAELPAVDAAFVADARERLVARLPSAAGAAATATRAGMLDMTPDGLPLVGPTQVPRLWLSCGWSGTGFKTGPVAGEALAGWIAGGVPDDVLAGFAPDRVFADDPLVVRSPH